MDASRLQRTNTNQDLDFAALFDDALKAYQAETKRDLNSTTLKKTLKTPEDLVAYIESQGQQFQNFRSKHGKLWSRMHAVLQPVTVIGDIAQNAVSAAGPLGPPASAVLGAVFYLIKAADGVKDAYDWIQTLFGEFEMFAVRLHEYTSTSRSLNTALVCQLCAILTCMLRLFGRSEALIKGGRFREYLRTTFLGRDDKTKDLLDELNRRLKDEQGLIMALSFSATKNAEDYSRAAAEAGHRIEKHLEQLKFNDAKSVAKTEDRKREIRSDQIEEMKEVLETPAADKVARLFSAQSRDLVHGTGAWLEKETLFGTWVEGGTPAIWILGGPGSGKSFLATWTKSYLQKHFGRRTSNLGTTAVAYFFIKDYDVALTDLNNILKTLALQIANVDLTFGQYIAAECMHRDATITEDDTWQSIFVGFYSSPEAKDHHAILILDGLDEAPGPVRKKLLAMIRDVEGTGKSNYLRDHIQFAVFGRPELRSDLEFHGQRNIIMVLQKNRDDINTFIASKLSDITLVQVMETKGSAGRKQATKLRRTIAKQVLYGADGVFLWAKLLMKELENLNLAQIGKVLKNPPYSLDEMISKLLQRISQEPGGGGAEASRMMMFVCFAQRPLLFGELKLFLSLPNQPPDVLLWHTIRGRFASLFELKYPHGYDPDHVQNEKADNVEDPKADGNSVTSKGESTDGRRASNQNTGENEEARETDNTEKSVAIIATAGLETNVTKDGETSTNYNRDRDSNNGDGGDDEDDDADFDFDEHGSNDTIVFDLGTLPREDQDAKDYAKTIHDERDQLMTSIQFSHQRIKDYLIAQGTRSAKPTSSHEIQIDADRAEIEMTICCLRALQLGYETKEHRTYLVRYPAQNFVLHLAKVEEDHLTAEDIRDIITDLVKLFYSDQTSKAILITAHTLYGPPAGKDEFWATWMGVQTHREVVQRWLRRPEIETIVTDHDTVTWVRRAQTSTVALLEPMMRGVSQMWLSKTGHDDEGLRDRTLWFVDVLRAFLSMDESGVITDEEFQTWSWVRGICQPPASSGQLRQVAEWAGLEKTSHWHLGLGWALMQFNHYDVAIAEFDKGIELDSHAWAALEGKACCLDYQARYEEAIVVIQRAIEEVPQSMVDIPLFLHSSISPIKRKMGDKQGSYEAAVKGFEMDHGDPIAQKQYILALSDAEDKALALVHFLEWLQQTRRYAGSSYLVELLCYGYDIYHEMGWACKKFGQPAFLLEAIDQALRRCEGQKTKKQLVMMTTRAAEVHYHYYLRDDDAIQLFEQSLALMSHDAPEEKDQFSKGRVTVLNTLDLIHFNLAVTAKQTGQDCSHFSSRLKELSVALDPSLYSHSYGFYDTSYPSLLWGRWLREYEGAGDELWRQSFRARLLELLDMLEDDDPANDTYALFAISRCLFHAGDRTNAGAALAILFTPGEIYIKQRGAQLRLSEAVTEDRMKEASTQHQGDVKVDVTDDHSGVEGSACELNGVIGTTEHNNLTTHWKSHAASKGQQPRWCQFNRNIKSHTVTKKPVGAKLELKLDENCWKYLCDECSRQTDLVDEMYFCEVCYDINWCEKCLPLARADNLGRRQCSPQHSFYRTWPVPEDAKDVAATWNDGVPCLRREWLEALRLQWI